MNQDDLLLPYATKPEIAKLARDLYLRLYQPERPADVNEADMEDVSDGGQSESMDDPPIDDNVALPIPPKRSDSKDFRDKMEQKKQKRKKGAPTTGLPSTTLLTAIKQEMKEYEVTGVRSEKLDKVRMSSGKS